MHESQLEKREESFRFTACLLVTAAFLITFVTVTFLGRVKHCDGDMYCDQLVARLIWEQKTLFPENWAFGNQYNVISTPVVMALFYGLTGSMSLSMAWASLVMVLLIVAAFFWAVRPFVRKPEAVFGLMMMLGSVISSPACSHIEGTCLYTMATYYACYLIVMLAVWGEWVRLVTGKRESIWTVSFAIMLVLSFLIGMQSIREFLMVMLPMAAVEILRLILVMIRKRGRLTKKELTPTAAAACLGIVNLLGNRFAASLNLAHKSIYGSAALRPVSQWGESFLYAMRNLSAISGLAFLKDSILPWPLPALAFVLWLAAVALVVSMLGITVRNVFFRGILYETPIESFALLAFVSLLGVFSVNLMLDMVVRSVYYFVWFPLVAFSAMAVLPKLRRRGKNLLTLVLCGLLMSNLVYSYAVSFLSARIPNRRVQEVADWIVDQGYEYVYGDWFVVTPIAAHSDGKFLPGTWGDEPFEILSYINLTDIYTEEHNKKAVIVTDVDTEQMMLDKLSEMGETLELQATFSDFYKVYTSSHQLMKP